MRDKRPETLDQNYIQPHHLSVKFNDLFPLIKWQERNFSYLYIANS